MYCYCRTKMNVGDECSLYEEFEQALQLYKISACNDYWIRDARTLENQKKRFPDTISDHILRLSSSENTLKVVEMKGNQNHKSYINFLSKQRLKLPNAVREQSKSVKAEKEMTNDNDAGDKKIFINVGFIGGGNMSTAIIKGILKYGNYPPSKIWVSGPHLENLEIHKKLGANITCKNGEVLHNCDVVFLGVKPGVLNNAIQGCLQSLPGNVLSKNVLFVSMLAGIDLEQLRQAVKVLPGQVSVVRMMPNTPMAVGAGICLYTPDSSVTKQQSTLLEKILEPCGVVTMIPESLMGPLGALSGCGPAFMYVVIEALADGAVKQGAPRAMAIKLAAQVLVGSGQMVSESGRHPAALKDEVCSPGGSTICGITALENGKIRATLINAVEAAAMKTQELGKK